MRPQVSGFDLELREMNPPWCLEKRMLAMQKRHGWSTSCKASGWPFKETLFENLPPCLGRRGCWLPPDRTPCPDVAEMPILTSVDFFPTPAAFVARAIHTRQGLWIACKPFFRSMCLVNNARQRRTNREMTLSLSAECLRHLWTASHTAGCQR